MEDEKKYTLSASLFGHSLDVRCVQGTQDNSILSGSRDKAAKLWRPDGRNGYVEVMSYREQKNFVMTILYLEPTADYPDGLVITGSNDHAIYVYNPQEPFPMLTLKEHSNAVCCLAKSFTPNTFLSSSWDSTAKLINVKDDRHVIVTFRQGHSAAIWACLQIADEQKHVVTASADKTIAVWDSRTGDKVKTLQGHTDCVRGLLDVPESKQFISVSNDASVRIWSYTGDSLDILYGHTNYIYSIARCPDASGLRFITSDEDRTVRVWHGGVNVDTFQVPAQSVWSVDCLPNGDVVTGSSDGVVRVFTRDETRFADEATLARFTSEVEALTKQSLQQIGGYKVSDLPGPEALYDPGKHAGQMKMVRESGGVVAYTWVDKGLDSHWEKVGDVLGSTDKNTNPDKTTHEGKSYDFVFTVDVEDGKPPLKLPYNRGQDPYQAANEFLAKNVLPSSYLEQVVDFILKNTRETLPPIGGGSVDPFTGGSRYVPGSGNSGSNGMTGSGGANLDPFTGANSYSTASSCDTDSGNTRYFPVATLKVFDVGDPRVILGKLKEFNSRNDSSINDSELESLVKLCTGPPDDPNVFDLLFKLLDWPDDLIFPVLDVIRLAVRNEKNNEIIANVNKGVILSKLMTFVDESCNIPNNLTLSLRTLSNLLLHDSGENLVFDHRFELVENITSIGSSSLNKNSQIALATLLLNLCLIVLKRHDDQLGVDVLAEVVPDILSKLGDPEAQFRGYVAMGTLLVTSRQIKAKVQGNNSFIDTLKLHLLDLGTQNELERKRRNCAKQVYDQLGPH